MNERRKLERALTMRIGPTGRAWQQLADVALASLGVSESAGRALAYLDRLGDCTRQGDLARTIGISEASLARTVKQLEQSGLVLRTPDEQDRRAYHLSLTRDGQALAARLDVRLARLRAQLLDGLGDETLENMVALLDLFNARIASRREDVARHGPDAYGEEDRPNHAVTGARPVMDRRHAADTPS